MSGVLLDARGCLTPAGLDTLRQAPVGKAPLELASHVASCARCQDRLLGGAPGRRGAARRPPAWRIWMVLGAALVAVLSALLAAWFLGGR
jgi:hypothetical protein